MTPDEAAVFTTLATNRKGLTAKGIAKRLRWYRQSPTQDFKRIQNQHRVLKALKTLQEQNLVTETMARNGSRYKLTQNQLS